jgi:hypothetical protein
MSFGLYFWTPERVVLTVGTGQPVVSAMVKPEKQDSSVWLNQKNSMCLLAKFPWNILVDNIKVMQYTIIHLTTHGHLKVI